MITYNELGRYGQFGNQLFEIAGTIGIATKMGYEFAFPEWKNYDHKGNEDINVQDYFVNPLPVTDQNLMQVSIPWGYRDVSPQDNVSLHGHMQSEKYFKHCEDVIRHYFQMKEMFCKLPRNAIAVHLRAGDYDGEYHPIMGRDYYERAMDIFEGFDYYLFSDDIPKLKSMLGERSDFHYMEGNSYMMDFYLMRNCEHFIISNSTYSWWAAWLGGGENKTVVAPNNWFGPKARLETKDIYPDNWIVI